MPVDGLGHEIAGAGKLWADCWAAALKLDEEALLVSDSPVDAEALNMANHPTKTGCWWFICPKSNRTPITGWLVQLTAVSSNPGTDTTKVDLCHGQVASFSESPSTTCECLRRGFNVG